MVSLVVWQLHSLCGGGWRWEWYCRFALIGSPAGSLGWKGLEVCASLVLQCVLRCWSSAIPLYRALPAITVTLGVRDNDPSYPVEFVVTSIEVDNFLLRTILSSIEIIWRISKRYSRLSYSSDQTTSRVSVIQRKLAGLIRVLVNTVA